MLTMEKTLKFIKPKLIDRHLEYQKKLFMHDKLF